jgi:hypothetical protein
MMAEIITTLKKQTLDAELIEDRVEAKSPRKSSRHEAFDYNVATNCLNLGITPSHFQRHACL